MAQFLTLQNASIIEAKAARLFYDDVLTRRRRETDTINSEVRSWYELSTKERYMWYTRAVYLLVEVYEWTKEGTGANLEAKLLNLFGE